MKKKIIPIVCLMLLLGCQKSNSSPAGSENSNPEDGTPKPPVAANPAIPVKDEWRKKLEACPLQLTQELSLEQVAETSRLMRQQCRFTDNEWAQVIRHTL